MSKGERAPATRRATAAPPDHRATRRLRGVDVDVSPLLFVNKNAAADKLVRWQAPSIRLCTRVLMEHARNDLGKYTRG